MRYLVPAVVALLVAAAAAQETPKPSRSMAEGLVRQCIERDKLAPPALQSGVEVGAGQGPMVLMVRRADGTFAVEEIERGAGDHGPAAHPKSVDLGPVELEDVTKAEKDAKGQKEAKAEKDAKGQKEAPPQAFVTVHLRQAKDELVIGTAASPRAVAGKRFEREPVLAFLKQERARPHDSKQPPIVLEVDVSMPMQDVLTVCELARQAGFESPLFAPQGTVNATPAAAKDLIAGLAARFAWPRERVGGHTMYKGELLILLDGPTTFGDVAPLLRECALAGIWQVGFVGQKDTRTRFKLPTHLPFDRGR